MMRGLLWLAAAQALLSWWWCSRSHKAPKPASECCVREAYRMGDSDVAIDYCRSHQTMRLVLWAEVLSVDETGHFNCERE